jgi:hypothetical protein
MSAITRPRATAWLVGAAGLMGMAGLAITQPVLDLFGRNPEFFVAGRHGRRQIVAFALIVAVVPSLVAVTVWTLSRLASRTAGRVVYGVALGGLSALFGLLALAHLGVTIWWLALVVAGAFAGVVVWLALTRSTARTLLSYLAVGNVAFLLLFLFASPTARVIQGGQADASDLGTVKMPPLQGPVVLVILDEFPVTTLMRPDGSVNAARFPNFARLAGSATWFRNASSHRASTSVAVPAILTGTRPKKGELPTFNDFPRNYFTLFGHRYRVNRYESVTNMCPASICAPPPPGSLNGELRDGAVVYGHQVLPPHLAEGLPSVDHSWGGFTKEGDGGTGSFGSSGQDAERSVGRDGYARWHGLDPGDRSAPGQFNAMRLTGSLIDSHPSVAMIHVALPHFPWTLTPWGTRMTQFPHRVLADASKKGQVLGAAQAYQLHAVQAGAADVAVGGLIDHLKQQGVWDKALVVVTSDHGTSLLPPDLGRRETPANREELLRMPLFIKAPGQAHGEVRDDVAQTIDILPSIIDLLGGRVDWHFDGHSLYDGSARHTEPKVSTSVRPALAVAARHARDFGGLDWKGLAATGIGKDIVGRPVSAFPRGAPSDMRWRADEQGLFSSLPTAGGAMPYVLLGDVGASGTHEPPELVVSVNGTLAGVLGAYIGKGAGWRFTGFVGPFYVDGANTVDAFEVEHTPSGVVLHPVPRLG